MRLLAAGMVGALSLIGCADSALNSDGQAVKGADSGTKLSVTADVIGPTCVGPDLAAVTLTGRLTSQASAAWADVSLTIDGITESIDEVQPTDYSKDGRVKWYDYSYDFELSGGTHQVQICFSQPSGKDRMVACSDVKTIVVECSQEQGGSCGDHPFGETVAQGNKNICAGFAAPHINVNAKGDFGDDAQLSITGPNGYSLNTGIAHSGNSCVYHYNWGNQFNNGGTGTYSFTVTGNGNTLSWSADLFCATK